MGHAGSREGRRAEPGRNRSDRAWLAHESTFEGSPVHWLPGSSAGAAGVLATLFILVFCLATEAGQREAERPRIPHRYDHLLRDVAESLSPDCIVMARTESSVNEAPQFAVAFYRSGDARLECLRPPDAGELEEGNYVGRISANAFDRLSRELVDLGFENGPEEMERIGCGGGAWYLAIQSKAGVRTLLANDPRWNPSARAMARRIDALLLETHWTRERAVDR